MPCLVQSEGGLPASLDPTESFLRGQVTQLKLDSGSPAL